MNILIGLAIAFVCINIILFSVYFMELDSKFIRNFEPTFRKHQKKYRQKHGLE